MTTTTRPPDTPTETPADPSGFQWSSIRTMAAVAVLLFAVAAGVWIGVTGPDSDADNGGPRPQGGPPAAAGEACGPTGGPQHNPVTAPDTDWVLLGGMAAPTSPTVGPAATTDGVPHCFAPTPTGALFTAATFLATGTDADLRYPGIAHLAADTPGRHTALADIFVRGPGPDTVDVQIAGYTVVSYTAADTAKIDLALRSRGVHLHWTVDLVWDGQDWKVLLPPTGRPLDDAFQPLPNLAGYTPWQGA